MATLVQSVWLRTKPYVPDLFTKGRWNFITIHYLYIAGLALLASVIMFGVGGLAYTDALFFASGGATQSGLNTVDVNKIHLGQQILLYLLAMVCNPIVIHGSVVFVRLHWFEKRFARVVEEARNLRRSKSRSRMPSRAKDDPELGRKEQGVRGRNITVLRDGRTFQGSLEDEKNRPKIVSESESSTSSPEATDNFFDSEEQDRSGTSSERRGAISVETLSPGEHRLPQPVGMDRHIAFLENQRSPKNKETLRIPSPREFDRGGRPEDVGTEVATSLSRRITVPTERPVFGAVDFAKSPVTGNRVVINEPTIPRSRDQHLNLPKHEQTKTTSFASETHPSPNMFARARSRQASNFKSLIRANSVFSRYRDDEPKEQAPYLSWVPTIVRNSTFVNLNEEQREELGGIEYRALKTLAVVLIVYYVFFHLLGLICLLPWIMNSAKYGKEVTSVGQGRPWWAIFTAASLFNDLGFTLTPNSMIPFSDAIFVLLLGTFLILIGNTGFPCMLRFVIWLTSKFTPRGTGLWEELQFLLDHPRRCFTLLFPRAATWWLFAILIVLNVVDIFFFVVLDLHTETVTRIPWGTKVVDGLFQAASTRTAGFSVVNLASLHPAVQVSYMIMMYISVFPIAISMRRTNVYEEKSLGIYGGTPEEIPESDAKEPSYIGAHLRKQLSFDLWYVFLGLFIIAIVEGDRIQDPDDFAFNMFAVLFEIISAYGTVGLSLGHPSVNTSFSGQFKTVSKLIIIAMEIRGRHRGLPYELDRAVLLPSESLHQKEAQEANKILARRRTSLGTMASRPDLSKAPSQPGTVHATPMTTNPTGHSCGDTTQAANVQVSSKEAAGDQVSDAEKDTIGQSQGTLRSALSNTMVKLSSPLTHHRSNEDNASKKD